MDNENSTQLAAKFLETWGTYPVIIIQETVYDDDDYTVIERKEYQVDTERLPLLDDFEFGYIRFILESALGGAFDKSTSRKYSFGDCPDWYAVLRPIAAFSDRVVSGFDVAVY